MDLALLDRGMHRRVFAGPLSGRTVQRPRLHRLLDQSKYACSGACRVLHGVIAFGLLFSGIPTGLIFYAHMMQKWLTPAAPKIMIGFIAFPVYTLAGAGGEIK